MDGSCLCGSVGFRLVVPPKAFYRCHCSLCRKQTGVGFNLATLVKLENFAWIKGEGAIKSWTKPGGYRTDFCSACGSTVPNILRGMPYVWIPVGLLDEDTNIPCIADYCTDDAKSWDTTRSERNHSGPVASLDALLRLLEV
ncbi:S-(hydroxymethyl)glutathione synthase [Pantoea alhagi]|uniref:S-(Hydroxymethyl)glutathione synthase n=1 Tax=Pantoea alhagi TaxID=1891675 RepID=A0A1W6B7N6_9GAMM|nr:GFA family protein [Pantoea alhagi]ARJ43091.1 S-(hydroxymethyl)glutathione synthase [Pantoea alhagi]